MVLQTALLRALVARRLVTVSEGTCLSSAFNGPLNSEGPISSLWPDKSSLQGTSSQIQLHLVPSPSPQNKKQDVGPASKRKTYQLCKLHRADLGFTRQLPSSCDIESQDNVVGLPPPERSQGPALGGALSKGREMRASAASGNSGPPIQKSYNIPPRTYMLILSHHNGNL